MGTKNRFVCADCDHTAEVSGGPDAGFEVVTQTVYCRSCRKLSDVTTAYRRGEPPHSYTVPISESSSAGDCRHCRGSNVVPWNNGDPCPRCGGTMTDEGYVMLWD